MPTEEILESLKLGYEEYKSALAMGSDKEDLAHIAGYCNTLEQLLVVYGGVSKQELKEMKKPIIGTIPLTRKKKKIDANTDYDVPAIFRKQARRR